VSADAGLVLVIDTATTRALVALGHEDGTLLAERSWIAGYRHGEELLPRIQGLFADEATGLSAVTAIVVGTGPGAFTGLRVGIATAKALAHARGVPIVGVGTAAALVAAATDVLATDATRAGATATGRTPVVVQPAGPADTVVTRAGEPARLVAGGGDPGIGPDETPIAVDLDGRASDEAIAAGASAVRGLGAALLAAGVSRLRAGDVDDLATLVPEYVTLPRGVRADVGDAGVALEGAGGAAGSRA
jgi:tRNA threonylcarbamoyl adenosine modification protein YeaZ